VFLTTLCSTQFFCTSDALIMRLLRWGVSVLDGVGATISLVMLLITFIVMKAFADKLPTGRAVRLGRSGDADSSS
jgi:hypothetical protein